MTSWKYIWAHRPMAILVLLNICCRNGIAVPEIEPVRGVGLPGAVVEVYLFGGQSNATGQGYVKNLPTSFLPNREVLLFHSGAPHLRGTGPARTWQSLQPASESPDRFGPELSFGNRLQELRPGRKIAIIKHAHSGTNLFSQWAPGADAADRAHWGPQFATFVATVDAALDALRAQGYAPVIRGMLWHQGESDGDKGPAIASAYAANFTHFIGRIREQFRAPQLVFVYGEIFALPERGVDSAAVLQAQKDLAEDSGQPGAVPGAFAVPTEDLTRRAEDPGTKYPKDREHMSSVGVIAFGRRAAEAMAAHLPGS